jgi:asparagine synthase (glutamine-hydrolysing)
MFRLASDAASILDISIWKVLADTLLTRLHPQRTPYVRDMMLEGRRLVSPGVLPPDSDAPGFPHPWFETADASSWSTALRLGVLVLTPSFYDPFHSSETLRPEIVRPLFSQPLVELCLRIPLYVHLDGGRDRGLARRAFARDVPPAILDREWKDRAPRFQEELLKWNLAFVREMLLDGALNREGLLRKDELANSLSAMPIRNSVFPGEILDHLCVETWLRTWKETSGTILSN